VHDFLNPVRAVLKHIFRLSRLWHRSPCQKPIRRRGRGQAVVWQMQQGPMGAKILLGKGPVQAPEGNAVLCCTRRGKRGQPISATKGRVK